MHSLPNFEQVRCSMYVSNCCFFKESTDVGDLISGSSAFSKTSLNIWKFMVHILLKPNLKDFERYLAGMWNENNCVVVWTFFCIALLWDWNENMPLIWNESPVQVQCMILDAWGWWTETTQRDGTGKEEGGRFRMGNTCVPVEDSCWRMAKPIQYCKVI